MMLSTRKEWIFNVALLLAATLAGLWTAFDRSADAQDPAIRPPRRQTEYGGAPPRLPVPSMVLPKGVTVPTPAPPSADGRPTPPAAKTPLGTTLPEPGAHVPDPVLTPVKPLPGIPAAATPAADALTTGSAVTTGTAAATPTPTPRPTPFVARYLNIGRVNLFSALITPTPTPTPRPPKPPPPPNLALALRYWVLDYPMKQRTIWVFHNSRTKKEYKVDINKPFDLTDGRRQFQATLIPDGKYAVKFVYPGPPQPMKQTIKFSMIE